MALTARTFSRLLTQLDAGIGKLCQDFSEFVRKFLLGHAKQLAQCSSLQMAEIKAMLRKRLGAGTHMNNAVDKAVLVGKGQMAPHLVFNVGITSTTFEALPARAQRTLNTGSVLIKQRNSVVSVPARKLTERQMRKAVSGKHPSWGIIRPADQNKPRAVRPAYFTLVGWRVEGKNVVLSWALNSVEFKSRMSVSKFKAMAKKL